MKVISYLLGLVVITIILHPTINFGQYDDVLLTNKDDHTFIFKQTSDGKISFIATKNQIIVFDNVKKEVISKKYYEHDFNCEINGNIVPIHVDYTGRIFWSQIKDLIPIPNSTNVIIQGVHDGEKNCDLMWNYQSDYNPSLLGIKDRELRDIKILGDEIVYFTPRYILAHHFVPRDGNDINNGDWEYYYTKEKKKTAIYKITKKKCHQGRSLDVSEDYWYAHQKNSSKLAAKEQIYSLFSFKENKLINFKGITGKMKNLTLSSNSKWVSALKENSNLILFQPETGESEEINYDKPIVSLFVFKNENQLIIQSADNGLMRFEKQGSKWIETHKIFLYSGTSIYYNDLFETLILFDKLKLKKLDLSNLDTEEIHDFNPSSNESLINAALNQENENIALLKKQELAEQASKDSLQRIEDDKIALAKYEKEEEVRIKKLKEDVLNEPYVNPADIKDPIPFPMSAVRHPVYEKAKLYTDISKWTEAEAYWKEVTLRYPDLAEGYYYTGEALFYQTKYEDAIVFFEQGHQMNPFESRFILNYLNCMGSFQYNNRAAEMGKKLASICFKDFVTARNISLDKVIANNGNDSPYSKPIITAKNAFNAQVSSIDLNDQLYPTLKNSFNVTGTADLEGIWANFLSIKTKLQKRDAESAVFHYLLKEYHESLYSEKDGYRIWLQDKISNEMIREYQNNKSSNIYFQTELGLAQFYQYFHQSDYEKASILIDKLILDLKPTGLFKFKLLELYQSKARILFEMDRNSEFASLAKELEAINGQYKNPKFNSKSLEMMTLLYKDSDFTKSEGYALKALEIAKINKLNSVATLESLLAIIYFDNGNTAKGLEYAGVKKDKSEMNNLDLFNVGSMLEDLGQLEKAEEYYLLSIDKSEKDLLGKSDREKLTERAKMDIVYASLAQTYHEMNKPQKAFEIVEKTKSQSLASNLNVKPASVEDIQAKLGIDEAFISYKKLNPSLLLLIVVTKSDVKSDLRYLNGMVNSTKDNFPDAFQMLDKKLAKEIYQEANFVPSASGLSPGRELNEGDFELFIEFYRTYLTGDLGKYLAGFTPQDAENVGNILQEELYGKLIRPAEQVVGKKSKYFLSLDGVLNFIPFDSFRDENKTLIGTSREFHIVNSAGIFSMLKDRKYDGEKKSAIAFGGAIYEETATETPVVSSFSEIKEWQLKSYELAENGELLVDLFKGMGYGKMHYLKGTLTEVQSIGATLEDSKIIVGEEMTEAKVKQLSKSGELKNYKVIHFATHGWAINSMPSVSGLAMCIPKVISDGEDGRLIANEIAKLDIEADMVMLSACQTGLGKLYGGEGVSGLNQSLLLAGANATIVTLWPVDDQATSILVQELYQKAKENGGDYAQALKDVKSNFISGKYNTESRDFRAPRYWAPFVYNGK